MEETNIQKLRERLKHFNYEAQLEGVKQTCEALLKDVEELKRRKFDKHGFIILYDEIKQLLEEKRKK